VFDPLKLENVLDGLNLSYNIPEWEREVD